MAHEIDGVGADKCVARGSGVDYFYVGFGGDVGVGLGGGEDGSCWGRGFRLFLCGSGRGCGGGLGGW